MVGYILQAGSGVSFAETPGARPGAPYLPFFKAAPLAT